MAAKLTFQMAAALKRGTPVEVQLTMGGVERGLLVGTMPGKDNAKSRRERADAIIVKNGALVAYIRQYDVEFVNA